MIPKITVLAIFLAVSWQQTVYGAAYSKVYVQSGPEFIPVEYLNYGAPPVVASQQIAQLSAPPVGSVLPLPNIVSPCVSPCILPSQTVATVAAVQPNAKYRNYNTPIVPATVVPTNDDKPSYEYSYVVYDEITGDRKAQRELSDGSVVRGEYSLIQPDGYVREVKYTADDLTGFNAVVTKFLPESVLGRGKIPDVKTDAGLPCEDIKNEAIKLEPEVNTLNHIEEPDHEEVNETTQEKFIAGRDHDHDHDHDHNHGHDHDHYHDHNHDYDHHDHNHAHESDTEKHTKGVHSEEIELTVVPAVEVAQVPEVLPSTTQPEPEHNTIQNQEPAAELIKQSTVDPLANKVQSTETSKTHESLQTPAVQQAAKPEASMPNGLVSYSDIIKCLQAAIANNSIIPNSKISPLTYIILPGTNKPC